MAADRRLIVNADDFGLTRGVNEGIVEAHLKGILTATTVMARGPAFAHAVALAKRTPTLDVGVHLVLWPDEKLPRKLPAFLGQAARLRAAEIEAIFAEQVEIVEAAGIRPTHLDTHKHTHLLPHVMRAVAAVARRFAITWVRRGIVSHGCRHVDHFRGIRLTGKLNRESLARFLQRLPTGVTELMCHPGRYDNDLELAPTRLKRERQIELEALTDPAVCKLAKTIQMVSFRDL